LIIHATDFDARAGQYRRELVVHCYRMLGSIHEAEDLVQDTMVRAWKAWDRYDGDRASVRTWLYKIATNVCLTALRRKARRPLPAGLGGPSDDPEASLVPSFETPWLQPFPDARLDDPAARVVRRGSLRLALVAAMQLLPARQRAVLILRDVLEFSAAEVAAMLDSSVASVNSALQRARAGLSGTESLEDQTAEPDDAHARDLVDRFIQAFEAADIDTLVSLLTDDVVLEMPPVPLWYVGRADYTRFMARFFTMRGTDFRVLHTSANTQPALAVYVRDGAGYRLHSLQILTITPTGIAHNVVYHDPRVFQEFTVPATLG
jgi:RNA polymerase sigma-70 factor, ECF subfamily